MKAQAKVLVSYKSSFCKLNLGLVTLVTSCSPTIITVTAVPSKKSTVQPGDRVLEINGVKHTEFKTQKRANDLFEMMVLDVIPDEEEEDEGEQ